MWRSLAPCCRGRPGAHLLRSPERACGPAPLEGSAHTSPAHPLPLAGLPVLPRFLLLPQAWNERLELGGPPAPRGSRREGGPECLPWGLHPLGTPKERGRQLGPIEPSPHPWLLCGKVFLRPLRVNIPNS